jgi:hypothetical protein
VEAGYGQEAKYSLRADVFRSAPAPKDRTSLNAVGMRQQRTSTASFEPPVGGREERFFAVVPCLVFVRSAAAIVSQA